MGRQLVRVNCNRNDVWGWNRMMGSDVVLSFDWCMPFVGMGLIARM